MPSRVQLFVTPWTVAHQTLLSMGFPRQEYWNLSPFPSPRNLPDTRFELGLLHYRLILYHLSHQGIPGKPFFFILLISKWYFKFSCINTIDILIYDVHLCALWQMRKGIHPLPQCRQILYWLSYEGSPFSRESTYEFMLKKAWFCLYPRSSWSLAEMNV